MTNRRRTSPRSSPAPQRRAWWSAPIALCAASLCLPTARAQFQGSDRTPGLKNETPAPIKGLELKNRLGESIPLDLTFTDSTGKEIKLADRFNRPALDQNGASLGYNKPVVLIMVYFRCSLLCPMVMEKFTKTLRDVDFTAGREFDAVVVSFDHRDNSTDAAAHKGAQLLVYNRGTGDQVRDGWTFLVGTPEHTRALGEAIGFPFRFLPESGEYSHGVCVFILTPDGRIARALPGLEYPAKDVRLALLEASQGKIGTLFDKFTFWCYHFDPSAATYSLQVMRIMQVGGAATTLAVGGLIGALIWRERRRRALPAPSSPAPQAPNRSTANPPRGPGAMPGVLS